MREGQGAGAESDSQSNSTNIPSCLYRSVFTLIDSASAIPKQTKIKHQTLCCCTKRLVHEQDFRVVSDILLPNWHGLYFIYLFK